MALSSVEVRFAGSESKRHPDQDQGLKRSRPMTALQQLAEEKRREEQLAEEKRRENRTRIFANFKTPLGGQVDTVSEPPPKSPAVFINMRAESAALERPPAHSSCANSAATDATDAPVRKRRPGGGRKPNDPNVVCELDIAHNCRKSANAETYKPSQWRGKRCMPCVQKDIKDKKREEEEKKKREEEEKKQREEQRA